LDTPAAAEVEGEGILLMTSYKWSGLSDGQRGLYVKSFLETTSFAMYRKDPPQQAQRDFAAWTACAETVPVERWQPLGWMIKGELKRSAASQFLEVAPLVCKDALPKLDKTLRLVRLISRSTWQSLGLRDRAIYMMGYVETVYEISRTMKRSDELRHLDICIGHVGIEGLMDALGTIDMEWQYPLPWSISRALGKACRPYR
jgi:hypothetical protein